MGKERVKKYWGKAGKGWVVGSSMQKLEESGQAEKYQAEIGWHKEIVWESKGQWNE